MTTEEDFQRALDVNPDDWQTRLVFADWLEERGDPRAPGYRAIATQRRRPLQSPSRKREACWWHYHPNDTYHNILPHDWFALLPKGEGSNTFWPLLIDANSVRSRRECEDALAVAFSQLPAGRQAELLTAAQTTTGVRHRDE